MSSGACSSTDEPNRHKRCHDPFNSHHQWKTRDLRPVSQTTVYNHTHLLDDKLCTLCRKQVSCHEEKHSNTSSDAESMTEDVASDPKLLSPTEQLSIRSSSLSVLL